MMYSITTEGSYDGRRNRTFKVFSEIAHELRRMQAERGYVVIVEVSPPMNGAHYLQVINDSFSKGVFKKRDTLLFTVKINITGVKGSKEPYTYNTSDFKEIETMFNEFVSFQKLPVYWEW